MRQFEVRYSPIDESIQTVEPLTQPIDYEVVSSGSVGNETPLPNRERSRIDPQIAAYARRPEVSGGLADARLALNAFQPAGGAISADAAGRTNRTQY